MADCKCDNGGNNYQYKPVSRAKAKIKTNTPRQTPVKKHSKGFHVSVWEKYTPKEPQEQMPIPPEIITPDPESSQKAYLINTKGSTVGEQKLILNPDNTVKQGIDIQGGHVHEAYTQTAFLMNNNSDSELVLSESTQRLDQSFDRLNANKSAGSEETVSKDEFFAFLADYSREAVESGTEGNAYRNKAAVHLDENNKQELGLAFEAIAGENKLIEKQEFIEFWDELLKNGEQYVDEKTGKTLTKVTGEQLNELVNKRLEAKGELPTFRKTDAEIKQLKLQQTIKSKEDELKNLKVNVNPDLVSNIEYSRGKSISFITLDDGTEIQISNPLNNDEKGVQITKEGDRYVITNNSSNKLKSEKERIIIIPSNDSKITLKDCSGVVFSSPGELNDDILIEGTAEEIALVVGGGIDKYVNTTDIATTKDEIRIIKDAFNTSVELKSERDIAWVRTDQTTSKDGKVKSHYYSVNSDYEKPHQERLLKETEIKLNTLSDMDLLKVALFGSVDDAGDISNEELLQKAKENGYQISEQPVLLTREERNRLNKELSEKGIDSKELSDTDLIKKYLYSTKKEIIKNEINTDEELLEYAQMKGVTGAENATEITTDLLVAIARKEKITFTEDVKDNKTFYLSAKERRNLVKEYIQDQKDFIKATNEQAKSAEEIGAKKEEEIDMRSDQIKKIESDYKKAEKAHNDAIKYNKPDENKWHRYVDDVGTALYDEKEKLKETYNKPLGTYNVFVDEPKE